MCKIYIILTNSGSLLSKIVRTYTRNEYAHVSISLDKDLKHMYSFGRLNAYIPFIGGFVQESPNYGTFKRFYKTKSKIYSLDICESSYNMIKKNIEEINVDKYNYKFNIIGMFAVALNLRVKRKRCFYCAEFVKYLFDISDLKIELPDLIKPNDFEDIEGSQEIYRGMLSQYKV